MKTFKKVLILCLLVVLSLTTLVACGEEAKTEDVHFTITFDLNTAVESAHFADSNDLAKTKTMELVNWQRIEAPKTPICEGYDFIGWFYSKNPAEDEKPVAFRYEGFGEDKTLYAKWEKKTVYTANFYLQDGNKSELLHTVKGNKDFKTSATTLADKVDKMIATKQEANPQFAVSPFFVAGKDGATLEIGYNDSIKFNDDFIKFANNNNTVDFYMNSVKTETLRRFKYNGNIIATVVCKDGKMDLDTAYVKNSAGVVVKPEFDIDSNGNKMPKIINESFEAYKGKYSIEEGRYFRYWQVDMQDGTSRYFDRYGLEIGTGKSLFDDVAAIDITGIDCIPEVWSCTITYKDNKGSELAKDVVNYGDKGLLDLANTKIGDTDDLTLQGWKYLGDYPLTGVSAGTSVENPHIIKDRDIVIEPYYIAKVPVVFFNIAKNQYFGNEAIKNIVLPINLEELKAYFDTTNAKHTDAVNALDPILTSYFIYPGLVTPTNIDRQRLTPLERQEIENIEKVANKAQKQLLGFAEPNSNTILLKVKDGKLTDSTDLDNLKFANNQITLVPVFGYNDVIGKGKLNTVKISDKARIQGADGKLLDGELEDYTINNGTPSAITMYTEASKNTSNFNNYTLLKKGYKFTGKWLVVSNSTFNNQNLFTGVEFTKNYPVFDEVVIQPVFERTNYTIKFINDVPLTATQSAVFVGDLTSNLGNCVDFDAIIERATTNAIKDYKDRYLQHIHIAERDAYFSNYYVFDDWYATIINDNNESVRVSLTQYLKDYNGKFDQDIKFTPSIVYKSYNIQYMYIDIELLKAVEQDIYSYAQMVTYKTKEQITLPSGRVVEAGTGLFVNGLLQQEAFDKNGLKKEYFNKLGTKVGANSVLNFKDYYKPKDENCDKTTAEYKMYENFIFTGLLGEDNFIDGWQYHDKVNNKWTRFTDKTSIAFETADIVDGTVVVYPLFKEFDVTLDFNGSGALLELAGGNKVSTYSVKGGYFGVNLKGIDASTLTRPGYTFNTFQIWDKTVEQNGAYVKYVKQQIIENTTLKGSWNTIDHIVKVYYLDTDKLFDASGFVNIDMFKNSENYTKVYYYGANIECLFEIDQQKATNGTITPAKDTDNKLVIANYNNLLAKANELPHIAGVDNPKDLYTVTVYQYNDKTQRCNNILSLDTATSDLTIIVDVTYEKLSLSLNANGGFYRGINTNGHEILEQFVDEKGVLTTTKGGIKSAYVTKNAEIGKFDFVDQGIPEKPGYIFAGYVAGVNKYGKPNADAITTLEGLKGATIYYGYSDASDILASDDSAIRDAITNKVFIGDTEFRTKATDVFTRVTTPTDKIDVKMLYAVWIPVKAQIIYCDEDGNPFGKVENEEITVKQNMDAINALVEELGNGIIDRSRFTSLLNPGDKILNPYHFNNDASDDKVVNWSVDKGFKETIEAGVVASEHKNFDYKSVTKLSSDGLYYVCNFNVYRQISDAQTIVDLNYMAKDNDKVLDRVLENIELSDYTKNHFLNDFATQVKIDGKFYYQDAEYLTLVGGKVYRKTYYVKELGIDRYIDQLQYGTQYEISAFLNGVVGKVEKISINNQVEYVYKKQLTLIPTTEVLDVDIITSYLDSETKIESASSVHNQYGKPLINPYYKGTFIEYRDYELMSEQAKKDFRKSGKPIAGYKFNGATYEKANNLYLATKFRVVNNNGTYKIQRYSWFYMEKTEDEKGNAVLVEKQELVTDFFTNTNATLTTTNLPITNFPQKENKVGKDYLPVYKQVEDGKIMFNSTVYGKWVDVNDGTTNKSSVSVNATYWYNKDGKEVPYAWKDAGQDKNSYTATLKNASTSNVYMYNPTTTERRFPDVINGIKAPQRRTWAYKGKTVDVSSKNAPTPTLSLSVQDITGGGFMPTDIMKAEDGAYNIKFDIKLQEVWVAEYYAEISFDTGQEIIYHYNGTPLTITEPVKEGYKFDGWFTDKECTIAFNQTEYEKNPTNIKLYAKFTENTTVTP